MRLCYLGHRKFSVSVKTIKWLNQVHWTRVCFEFLGCCIFLKTFIGLSLKIHLMKTYKGLPGRINYVLCACVPCMYVCSHQIQPPSILQYGQHCMSTSVC